MDRRGFFAGLIGVVGAGLARLLPGAGDVVAGADWATGEDCTLFGMPVRFTNFGDDHGGIPVPDDLAGPLLDEMRRQVGTEPGSFADYWARRYGSRTIARE